MPPRSPHCDYSNKGESWSVAYTLGRRAGAVRVFRSVGQRICSRDGLAISISDDK